MAIQGLLRHTSGGQTPLEKMMRPKLEQCHRTFEFDGRYRGDPFVAQAKGCLLVYLCGLKLQGDMCFHGGVHDRITISSSFPATAAAAAAAIDVSVVYRVSDIATRSWWYYVMR